MDYIERAKNGEDINKLVAEFTKTLKDSVKVSRQDKFRDRFRVQMKAWIDLFQEYLDTDLEVTDEDLNKWANELMAHLNTMQGLRDIVDSLTTNYKKNPKSTTLDDPLAKFFNEYGL